MGAATTGNSGFPSAVTQHSSDAALLEANSWVNSEADIRHIKVRTGEWQKLKSRQQRLHSPSEPWIKSKHCCSVKLNRALCLITSHMLIWVPPQDTCWPTCETALWKNITQMNNYDKMSIRNSFSEWVFVFRCPLVAGSWATACCNVVANDFFIIIILFLPPPSAAFLTPSALWSAPPSLASRVQLAVFLIAVHILWWGALQSQASKFRGGSRSAVAKMCTFWRKWFCICLGPLMMFSWDKAAEFG